MKCVGLDQLMETPPPAWGRLKKAQELGIKIGNTPTCVGKTKKAGHEQYVSQKHPHLRGEDKVA